MFSRFCIQYYVFQTTWFDDLRNFVYDLPKYKNNYQKRSDRQGGAVSVYIYNSFNFKTKSDFNSEYAESVTI